MIDYKLPEVLSQARQNTSTEKATTAHFISEVALVSVIFLVTTMLVS
jgi:hypothetical protein